MSEPRKVWVYISRNTGMPLEVQKCDFQPTVLLAAKPGNWKEFTEVPSPDTRQERAMEKLREMKRLILKKDLFKTVGADFADIFLDLEEILEGKSNG